MSNYDAQDWRDALRKLMEPYGVEAKAEDVISSVFTRR